MAADYRNFKTPFYEIEIGDSSGKKLVKLPHHILRLVEKVEITETFVGGQFNTFNLDFIEGSREPASPDASLGTDGLYKIPINGQNADMEISGSITNRIGAITDLKFSGTGGITFLTEEERQTGAVDRTVQQNITGDIVTRSHKKESSRPTFLFQERNQIKITWGYVEDQRSIRSIRGYIIMLSTTFPETGQVKTTITCQDTRSALDQIAPTKGITFGTRTTTSKGNSIVVFSDQKTDKVIRDICDKAGIAAIISTNLPADTVDSDKQKIWLAGESFHQFMTRLADIHHAYYSVFPDPKTGKDTLVFIKKQDFENKLVITDRDLTTYKGAGSILKSVEIKADFGSPTGNMQKSVNNDGKEHGAINNSVNMRQFKNEAGKLEEVMPNSPVDEGNPIAAAKGIHDNIANSQTTGTVNINPSNTRDRLDKIAESTSSENARNILLEFTSLGYTKYSPGVIEFRNLGVRYSGKYRLQTITHTIDSTGYVTKGTAVSMAVATGGVQIPDLPKAADEPKKTNVQQFKGENDIMDKYHKTIEVDK